MGGVHLNAYAGIPEVEVVGVADARVEAAVAGANMVGARPYASYEELVSAEDVEVVPVFSWGTSSGSSPSTWRSRRRSRPETSGRSGWSAPAAAHPSCSVGTTGTPTGA